jgi:hypothetical protein
MKVLIVSTVPVANNHVTIHAKNAVVIQNYLADAGVCSVIVWREDQIDIEEQFDYIIFVSATGYFKFHKFELLMDNQRRCKVGWIANEYELFQNDFLKGRTDFIIANFQQEIGKKANTCNEWLTVNLNALAINSEVVAPKEYDLCYYGSYRKNRIPYFKKWLQGNMILSTSKKNWHKFASLGCDCKVTTPFQWGHDATLARFKASLYIEDVVTHKHYNFLANRFYECLNCNTIPVFDSSCMSTIKRSGYYIPDYLILNDSVGMDYIACMPDNFFTINRELARFDKETCLKQIHSFLC